MKHEPRTATYRRMRAALGRRQLHISEKVVQRLMKQECLVVAANRRRRYGSYLGEISPAPENLINRDFHAATPNEKWHTDITEFQIPAGSSLRPDGEATCKSDAHSAAPEVGVRQGAPIDRGHGGGRIGQRKNYRRPFSAAPTEPIAAVRIATSETRRS